ncbi:MAG: cytidylate kinase-like family protein [Desulfobacterales bacterium]|jgi:cytidylate kinase
MRAKSRSVEQLIEEQVRKWQFSRAEPKTKEVFRPIVTLSREPGSGGNVIGERLARRLSLDLFHQEVIHAMAKSAKVSAQLMETLDERGLTVLDDWMAYLVDARHMWPDQYIKHLMKVIGAVGRHGGAVLIGRGANFILPPERRFSVRVIAPIDVRIANVARNHQVSEKEARNRIVKTDSQRRAFVRKYFNTSIADPLHYDMLINTGSASIGGAVEAIAAFLGMGAESESARRPAAVAAPKA